MISNLVAAAVVLLGMGPLASAGPPPTTTTSSAFVLPTDWPTFNGTGPTMLRFSCHQLVIDRIDPLVNPGSIPSPHQHQIVGGDAFHASMPYTDIASLSSCTTCSYSDDFSNYWTSNLYFRARNGSYKRVPQAPNAANADFFNDTFSPHARGGLVAYYVSPGQDMVTAFRPGFRMFFGDASLRSKPTDGPWDLSTQTCFRCYSGPDFAGDVGPPCSDPAVDSMHLPTRPCHMIRSNILFPT